MIGNKKMIQLRGWHFCCLFVFTASCNNIPTYNQLILTHADSIHTALKNKKAYYTIAEVKSLIKQGDIITRTGNDFTSESLRQLSLTDKTYSHCGIAFIEHDSVFVYHALGGEWNPDEKLRRDPVELFCNPEENRGFGIFTFNLDEVKKNNLDSIVRSWYEKKVMFDMKFDLKTDERLYCAEFVSKAIASASRKQIIFIPSFLNNFEFVAVDNIILNKNCTEKIRVRF